jgi:endoglucanase Acf2
MRTIKLLLVFLVSQAITTIDCASIPVGLGSYTTQLPAGQKGPSNRLGAPAVPQLSPNFNQLTLSNKWWSSLMWRNNPENIGENLFPDPLSAHAYLNGLSIGYSNKATVYPEITQHYGYKSVEYHHEHREDLRIALAGMTNAPVTVAKYSDWTVTPEWRDATRTLQATLGNGLPFVYFTTNGGSAQISFTGTPTIWYNTNEVIGVTINGHNYGIFAPTGSTWTRAGNIVTSTLNGKQFFSIALLPDNAQATLQFYRRRAYAFVTKTTVTWQYDQANAVITADYNFQTNLMQQDGTNLNNPVIALYRHQWLNTDQSFTNYTYSGPRGVMKVADTSSFTTVLPFHGILPALPLVATQGLNGFDSNQLYQYVDQIYKQSYNTRWQGPPTDTYWNGKALGRIALLIQIADQIKYTKARDLFLTELKQRLQEWLSTGGPSVFYYDKTWHSAIGYPASYGSDTANNDHHFHWGYFIIAAATVAHFDPGWAQLANWGSMVEFLIKDVDNWNRNDTQFPFLRFFDIYKGHSWANGPATFAAGNNQESSSESMNFASGVILWGIATNNPTIRDLGIYLYTTETAAIEQYWFDVDNVNFPANYNRPVVGMVWGNGGAYLTWWDAHIEEVHGINFTPIQWGSLYLGYHPDYLKINQDYMRANGGTNDVWRDIHMGTQALYDPVGAIARFNAGYTTEAGETKAHTYYWIHELNKVGRVDTTVRANIPTYGVFNKNGTRTYIAYNPSNAPITVRFSDGATLAVNAKSFNTSLGPVITPPGPTGATGAGSTGIQTDDYTVSFNPDLYGNLTILFIPRATSQFVDIHFKLNGGQTLSYRMVNNSQGWQWIIAGLKKNDIISYSFTYEKNGLAVDTASSQYTYPIDPQNEFKQSISGSQFNFIPNNPSKFVDVHYKINNGGQQNFRMINNNGTWTYPISLRSGDQVAYSFTYEKNGLAVDTQWFNYTQP